MFWYDEAFLLPMPQVFQGIILQNIFTADLQYFLTASYFSINIFAPTGSPTCSYSYICIYIYVCMCIYLSNLLLYKSKKIQIKKYEPITGMHCIQKCYSTAFHFLIFRMIPQKLPQVNSIAEEFSNIYRIFILFNRSIK